MPTRVIPVFAAIVAALFVSGCSKLFDKQGEQPYASVYFSPIDGALKIVVEPKDSGIRIAEESSVHLYRSVDPPSGEIDQARIYPETREFREGIRKANGEAITQVEADWDRLERQASFVSPFFIPEPRESIEVDPGIYLYVKFVIYVWKPGEREKGRYLRPTWINGPGVNYPGGWVKIE